MKNILKIGSCIILTGLTYLISKKSNEKEEEYFEIKEKEPTKTLQLFQLLINKSEQICIDIYNQSIPIVKQNFIIETKENEKQTKEMKIKQIQKLTQTIISEWYSKIINLTLITFSTHLGIIINKNTIKMKEFEIETIITEPTKRINEYCKLIENIILNKNLKIFDKIEQIDLHEVFEDIQNSIIDEMILFVENIFKEKIKNDDEEAFIDDLHVNELLEILIKYYCSIIHEIIFKLNENNSSLLFCQFISKCNESIQMIEIDSELFHCNEFDQKLFLFFQ